MLKKLKRWCRRRWRWVMVATVATLAIGVAVNLVMPEGADLDETGQPKHVTLREQDRLLPEAAVSAHAGYPEALLQRTAIMLAIDNEVAGGRHIDHFLENWEAVLECRLAWPEGTQDTMAANDLVYTCIRETLRDAPAKTYGDAWARDRALRPAMADLHEMTLGATDPASWRPELAAFTEPCRASYRAYARTVETSLFDRASTWQFARNGFNHCILEMRQNAVEPVATPETEPTTPAGLTPPAPTPER